MTSGSHRMPADPHIVGGSRKAASTRAPLPMTRCRNPASRPSPHPIRCSPRNPDITRLRSWHYRKGRDDLIIGIGGRREDDVDLAGRKAGQSGIDIDIDRSEFAQFQLQDFDIPAGIESNLVVGNPERSLLCLREAGQGDGWNLSKPHRPGGQKPAMTRDDVALRISKDRIGEAERFDRCFDLIDLALGMGAGIARIRNEVTDGAVSNGQPRREAWRCWFVHEQGTIVMMSDRSLLSPAWSRRSHKGSPTNRARQWRRLKCLDSCGLSPVQRLQKA